MLKGQRTVIFLSASLALAAPLALNGCATLMELQAMNDQWDNPGAQTRGHEPEEPTTLFDWLSSGDGGSRRPASAPSRRSSSSRSRFSAADELAQEDPYVRPRSSDLYLGMGMTDVRSSWGEPRAVETAGDPAYGNQRWIYQRGYARLGGQTRIVYFEAGRVVGWETR